MNERTVVQNGEYMKLREDGQIYRPSLPSPYNTPSGKWLITGAVMLNNFGNVTRRYTLAQIMESPGDIPWQHKNGKQRVHLTDYDHGTHRMWGSPNHRVF